MPHTVGTVITAEAIGNGVELQGGVTIGQRRGDGFPTLEDGVTVGAGARVLGRVRVGHGATVGANAVVVHDVAPSLTVVGIPARPLARAIV
jgi:serine O-acetyltransferase